MSKKNIKKTILYTISGVLTAMVSAFVILTIVRIVDFHHLKVPEQLTVEQQSELSSKLDGLYPERTKILHPLPYKTKPVNLSVAAGSAILIDTEDGSVLYEKNADEEIPPASMTKLVVMYIVLQEIALGHVSFDDIVPLPKECWAINMPHDSSLMFLAEGQKVTLRELMKGLDIDSGNDAAVAIAFYISGSVTKFVDRMNNEVKKLGLTHTHFVDSSGYSEKNITTPREFATFARIYLTHFPDTLKEFHSVRSFSYPLAHNLPDSQKSQGDSQAITQYNTNKLLGLLPGCDGLKTGFIYESGFNLALTAMRNKTRFLSITMKGPGTGSTEGNKYRIQDGTTLMEWAFSHFAEFAATQQARKIYSYLVPVTGARKNSVNLIPVSQTQALTVPFLTGKTPQEAASNVIVTAELPSYIKDGTREGTVYGYLVYKLNDTELQRIPLTADRTIQRAIWPLRMADAIAIHTLR